MSWLQKQSVLVPTDFSEASLAVLPTAREFIAQESQLHIVHVLPAKLHPAEPGAMWQTVTEDSRRQHAAAALKAKLQAQGYGDAQVRILFGTPSHEIADYAQQQAIELIVMPTHGYTGIKRVLMGSVAEQVARLAPCPVLLLRA